MLLNSVGSPSRGELPGELLCLRRPQGHLTLQADRLPFFCGAPETMKMRHHAILESSTCGPSCFESGCCWLLQFPVAFRQPWPTSARLRAVDASPGSGWIEISLSLEKQALTLKPEAYLAGSRFPELSGSVTRFSVREACDRNHEESSYSSSSLHRETTAQLAANLISSAKRVAREP
ncbi:unnamed protein product [Symbiodinium natans]|uniref:Uncharacterized protein n=1 Tax=Symbiodinium natans TaxID=878477 RepID=A0A812PQA1_9DINO|nr:unnamed protein product [Symbiodinium natans]